MLMIRLLILAAVALPVVHAQSNDLFEQRRKAQQESFESRRQSISQNWSQRQQALERNWDAHLARIRQHWTEALASSRASHVIYSDDYQNRIQIHYNPDEAEGGSLEIEVLLPATTARPRQAAQPQIQQQLELVLDDRGPDPLLKDNLEPLQGGAIAELGEEKASQEISQQAEVRRVQDPSGQELIQVRVVLPMVPDHLQRRARKWKPQVDRMAARWELPADLIWAVIQTESYFNPNARSTAPAYGLMQLVPSSGGAEAWSVVKHKAGKPSPDYLYNGNQNIELGAAYLHKLRDSYYAKVQNTQKAEMLIVCAYNTGMGNVSRALTSTGGGQRLSSGRKKGYLKPQNSSRRISDSLPHIRKHSVASLREKLHQDLPWQETVDYLDKVETRRQSYLAWN